MTTKSENSIDFIQKVEALRQHTQLNLKEIAHQLEVNYTTFKNYKYNRQKIPKEVNDALNVLFSDTLGDDFFDNKEQNEGMDHLKEVIKSKDQLIESLNQQIEFLKSLIK